MGTTEGWTGDSEVHCGESEHLAPEQWRGLVAFGKPS